jgi:hypothetical protein
VFGTEAAVEVVEVPRDDKWGRVVSRRKR